LTLAAPELSVVADEALKLPLPVLLVAIENRKTWLATPTPPAFFATIESVTGVPAAADVEAEVVVSVEPEI
jgi:hypothetical protein